MTSRQEIVPVQLADGTKLHIKATILRGEEDVAFKLLSFEQVTDTIEHVSTALTAALKKAKPKKASVEFGLEIAVEAGKLTALHHYTVELMRRWVAASERRTVVDVLR